MRKDRPLKITDGIRRQAYSKITVAKMLQEVTISKETQTYGISSLQPHLFGLCDVPLTLFGRLCKEGRESFLRAVESNY